jgi:methyl-accepting chemotaxis protein
MSVLEDIDDRLKQLITVVEKLTAYTGAYMELTQAQGARLDRITEVIVTQSHNMERLLHISISQQESLTTTYKTFNEQASAILELSRSMRDAMESSRELLRMTEVASDLAKNNQATIRDLLEELRQSRNN